MLDHRQQIERELIQPCFNHRAVFRIAAASLSKLPVDDLDRKATSVIGCDRIRQFEQFPLSGLGASRTVDDPCISFVGRPRKR
jgi:hypothetical protein